MIDSLTHTGSNTKVILAASEALKRANAAEAAAMDFPWDITSPEGLIAFFGEKLKSTNSDLKDLMRGQENRSTTIKHLQTMTNMLSNDKDMNPASLDWPEFQRLAALVGPSLGISGDARDLMNALQSTTAPSENSDTFKPDNTDGQAAFLKAHPGATSYPDGNDRNHIRMSAFDGPPKGVDAAGAKELGGKIKAYSENLQSENQMDAIRVQELVGRISQIMSLASNILHKFDEAAMAPIQNVK